MLACEMGSMAGRTMREMRRGPVAFLAGAAALMLMGSACIGGAASPGGAAGPSTPRVGAPAPPFSLASAQGATVSLSEFRGHKAVLLYFSMGPG